MGLLGPGTGEACHCGGFTVEVPSSLPDHRTHEKRKINNNQRRCGLIHVGAASLACGLERCNQARGVSLGLRRLIVGMLDF